MIHLLRMSLSTCCPQHKTLYGYVRHQHAHLSTTWTSVVLTGMRSSFKSHQHHQRKIHTGHESESHVQPYELLA